MSLPAHRDPDPAMILPKARSRLRSALVAACTLAGAAGDPGRLAAQEGAAAVQDVTITDVTLALGGTLIRAPKLTASGTRLTRDELAGILRPDSPEPWETRLARLDAASLTIPVLISEQAGPGDDRQVVTYRDVVARDVRAGRIGELDAAGATISAALGPNRGSGTYGQLQATDLDLAALNRLYAAPGDGTGPVQRVYGSVRVADIAYADARGTTVKIARLGGRDLGGRQVPGGWNGAFETIAAGFRDAGDRRAFAASAADLIEASALGSLDIQDLSVSETGPQAPALIEIGHVAYAAAGPDAGTVLENLALSRADLRIRLGRLAFTGVSLAPTVAALRAAAADPEPRAGFSEAELRRLTPALGALTLGDLSVDLPQDGEPTRPELRSGRPSVRGGSFDPGRPAAAKAPDARPGDPLAVTVAPPPARRIALREAALSFGPPQDGLPSTSRLTVAGLSLPADLVAGAPLIGALPAYGYRDLDLDLAADAALDEKTRDLALRELTVTGRDIGIVRLSGTLGGIGPELFSGSVPAATMLMFSGSAKSLDLTVENGGLFERFLAAQSKDLSLKPDELRKEYVTASLLGVPIILGNGPAAKGIGAALGRFVMKPGKLVVHARSKEPAGLAFIDLGAARSPAAVLDRLDVDATAN